MPTYHACNITVRLGSVPLAETTTSNIVLRKGEVAKRQSEQAEKELLHSSFLKERRVLFPGDPDGFELNWLGNAPFMQVQVDDGFARSSALSGGLPQDRAAQALALHVKLSDKALHSGFTGKTHLKIEVLFNGQLSACSLIHTNDVRSGAKSLHQVFAGYRVDFLCERPWVLLPPFTTADGSTRRFRKTITPLERFNEVSAALLAEVEERGKDKDGDLPPSAVFLDALARMQVPACVMNMQKPGGRKLGVVDVIITAGAGHKITTGTNYLKRPQRLKDPSFSVQTRTEDKIETAKPLTNNKGNEVERLPKAMASDMNNETTITGDTVNSQHQRPCKRRALSAIDDLPQHATQDTEFQSPFSGTQVPYLARPDHSKSHVDKPSIPNRLSPRCPSPEHRSDGHKEPLPSNDRNQTFDTTSKLQNPHSWPDNATHLPQMYQSPPSSLCSNNSRPLHLPSVPIRDLLGDDVPAQTMLDGPAFPKLTPGLDTVAETGIDQPSCFPQPVWSGRTHRLSPDINPISNSGSANTYKAALAYVHSTTTSWPGSPNSITSPYSHPQYLPQQALPSISTPSPASYIPQIGPPTLLPPTPAFFSHPVSFPFSGFMMPSSARSQAYGPPPPTAMFSIPTKSGQSALPKKKASLIKTAEPRPTFNVSRLVITGLHGRLVVDHRWKVAQSICVNQDRVIKDNLNVQAKGPGSEYGESGVGTPGALQQGGLFNSNPDPIVRASSPVMKMKCTITEQQHEQRRDSLQDDRVDEATQKSLPYLKRHQGPMDQDTPINLQIDVPDNIARFVPAAMLTDRATAPASVSTQIPILASSPQPTVSRHRTSSRHAMPSIQGPKAATFLFDDPEEVLREAARMRRSKSPTKPAAPCLAPTTFPVQTDTKTDQRDPDSSSPLSSVPCSSLSDEPPAVVNAPSLPPDTIPQLDGLPEDVLSTPSPIKPSLFLAPTPQSSTSASAKPSQSPNSKKRKAPHQTPIETPRSPHRVQTLDNPPLNDDCVIAFAESMNKKEEKAVLRQIKGERQGVFKEEYVVLAVRFFVPGG